MSYDFNLLNQTMKAIFAAMDKPRSIPECGHRSNFDEDKDHWEYMSGRRIAAYLFRNSYRCRVCGEYATRIQEGPNAP